MVIHMYHVHTAQALHRIKCEAEEEERRRRSIKGISTTQKVYFAVRSVVRDENET